MGKFETEYDIEARTYAALFRTAEHLLESAKAREAGRLFDLQAAVVFLAFAFEAYLNHVGHAEIEEWRTVDRGSAEKKLRMLRDRLGFSDDPSKAPFQVVAEVRRLRNSLAHGRTLRLRKISKKTPDANAAWRVLPEELLTVERVLAFDRHTRDAVRRINAARSKPDGRLWSLGSRGYTRRAII
jgi:hypothetical protein